MRHVHLDVFKHLEEDFIRREGQANIAKASPCRLHDLIREGLTHGRETEPLANWHYVFVAFKCWQSLFLDCTRSCPSYRGVCRNDAGPHIGFYIRGYKKQMNEHDWEDPIVSAMEIENCLPAPPLPEARLALITPMDIEGVAAQLYERNLPRYSRNRFWVELREVTKERWRREARRKINNGQIPIRVF